MRRGGVSVPPWESLNFSTSTGDSPDAVAENLRRAARELALDATRIYYLSQVHGCDIEVLAGGEACADVTRRQGDITATRASGVGCGVRMADCAAVLLADRETGAVAAVHNGWRGTVRRACAAAVRQMHEWGARDLIAAVGPHIERCCFEVGEDVAVELADASSLGEDAVDRKRARPHVDLRGILAAQLHELGVAEVDHVAGCTVCDPERFHSYRRDGPKSGRMLAVVAGRS
jgi:YfiH family protein